jgi:hypothetical protein
MAIQRMDHVGVVVDYLAAAVAFFVELGLEVEGEGPEAVAPTASSSLWLKSWTEADGNSLASKGASADDVDR